MRIGTYLSLANMCGLVGTGQAQYVVRNPHTYTGPRTQLCANNEG